MRINSKVLRYTAAAAMVAAVALGGAGNAEATPVMSHQPTVSSRTTEVAHPMTSESLVSQRWVGGALVQLWYHDGWNWVSVNGAGGRGAEAGIYTAASGWRWTMSYGSAPNWFTTPAVWAPGSTCVYAYANVQSNWWPYSPQQYGWWVC